MGWALNFAQLTRTEVPRREAGLTRTGLAGRVEHRQISGCLPGAPPPVSARTEPPGDGRDKTGRSDATHRTP